MLLVNCRSSVASSESHWLLTFAIDQNSDWWTASAYSTAAQSWLPDIGESVEDTLNFVEVALIDISASFELISEHCRACAAHKPKRPTRLR